MFEFEYVEEGEVEPPEVEETFDDSYWRQKCNPNPIVKNEALQLMRKLQGLENQFFAKELLNRRSSKFTSYDVCPKGSFLSKEHKVSIPGPFHGCPFNHLTAGGDYLTMPDPMINSTSAAADLKSSKIPSTKKTKTRPSCSKCSFVCFGHEDASICHSTYLQQCTFAHLPPGGPEMDKPIKNPGQALKVALGNVKPHHILHSDEIKNALLGGTISSSTPRNWLEELKDLVDPSKRQKLFETVYKMDKGKKGSNKTKRNLRLVKTPRPMPPISSRLTKSSNPTGRPSTAVVVQKPESMAAVNKRFASVKSRYLNKPARLEKSKEFIGESGDGFVFKPYKTERSLKKLARPRTSTSLTAKISSTNIKIPKPKSKIILAAGDAVFRRKTSIGNQLNESTTRTNTTIRKKMSTANNTGNKSGIVRKRRKLKPKTSNETHPGESKLRQKLSSATVTTIKKKKLVKAKPTVVHQAFGFEFEHSAVQPRRRKKKKPLTTEKYRDCILKMLEKGEKKVEKNPSASFGNNAEGDDDGDNIGKEIEEKKSVIKKPKFRRHRKLRPKKPSDDNEKPGKGPVTIVLYKSQTKPSKSSTVFPKTNSDGPKKTSPVKEAEQEKAGSSGVTNWAQKNYLFLPMGVNIKPPPPTNLPAPQRGPGTTEARNDELQSLVISKGIAPSSRRPDHRTRRPELP